MRDDADEIVTNERANGFKHIGVEAWAAVTDSKRSAATWMPARLSATAVAWDFAYFMCNSVPTDLRRAYQDDLISLYRRTLELYGCSVDDTTACEHYRP